MSGGKRWTRRWVSTQISKWYLPTRDSVLCSLDPCFSTLKTLRCVDTKKSTHLRLSKIEERYFRSWLKRGLYVEQRQTPCQWCHRDVCDCTNKASRSPKHLIHTKWQWCYWHHQEWLERNKEQAVVISKWYSLSAPPGPVFHNHQSPDPQQHLMIHSDEYTARQQQWV